MYQLHNGDCLKVLKELESGSVDAVITDPPYGIGYQSARRTDKEARLKKIANDETPFIWWIYDAARVLKNTGSMTCFCRWDVQDSFVSAIKIAGLEVKSQIVWDKGIHGLGDLKAAFAPQHEIAIFAVKPEFEFRNGRPKTVLYSQRVDPEKLTHPNEKPVSLMAQIIRATTIEGDTVLDPFMGSGSTGLACKLNNRRFIGCELDSEHFSKAQEKIEQSMSLFGGAA